MKEIFWRCSLLSPSPTFLEIKNFGGVIFFKTFFVETISSLFRFIGEWVIHGIFSVFFLILRATLKFAIHYPLAYKREIREKKMLFFLFFCAMSF